MIAANHGSVAISDMVREGDVIAEKYRLEGIIGEGGMAVVFAARHLQLDRMVALKILKPSTLSSPDGVVRFLREAKAVSGLFSEHVATVLDVGVSGQGVPYLVMEYLQGADLSSVLADRGRLPMEEAIDLLLQAMDAIAEAHAHGIVHRDLKPENVFLTSRADGTPLIKVLDFGIASIAAGPGQTDPGLTQPTSVFGSPAYMSPEQARSSHDVDARSDIWALGVILYELVSGSLPFNGKSAFETCVMVLRDEPVSLAAACPDLPAGFITEVHKCLNKDPEGRCENVAALARAIAPYGGMAAQESAERIRIVLEGGAPSLPRPAAATIELAGDPPRELTLNAIHRGNHPTLTSGASLPSALSVPVTQQSRAGWRPWAGLIAAAALVLSSLVGVTFCSTDRPAIPDALSAGRAHAAAPEVPASTEVLPSTPTQPPAVSAAPPVANDLAAAPPAHADEITPAKSLPVAPTHVPTRTDLYGSRR